MEVALRHWTWILPENIYSWQASSVHLYEIGWGSMRVVTDAEISAFIKEKKLLPEGLSVSLRPGTISNKWQADVVGEKGTMFRVVVRQSKRNAQDFSVIFGVMLGKTMFRLKRYNGNSHIHYNKIEMKHIKGMHIHSATQRYQERGYAEDGYAESTPRYNDWHQALKAMLADNNFHESKRSSQTQLHVEEDDGN
jgi:hypothetical protein